MIVGIAGTIGSGKGTVVEYLKKHGFAHYSSSGILKEIVLERGLAATRLNLSTLANELMEQYPGGIFHLSNERAQRDGVENYILESIHRVSEANYIRSLGGKIIGVDADLRTRYERSVRRGEGEKDAVTFEQFEADARREDEGEGSTGPNIQEVLKGADIIFLNNGTQEELASQIESSLSLLESA